MVGVTASVRSVDDIMPPITGMVIRRPRPSKDGHSNFGQASKRTPHTADHANHVRARRLRGAHNGLLSCETRTEDGSEWSEYVAGSYSLRIPYEESLERT
ncbi:hypothetical protein GCM10022626_06830 [[Pseudomonas] carboxydohydrogena]